MKCLVLAGGSGDRLWPLSRKNYPKQFIQIQKNHSIFQETVARNMPFCDEFIVVTRKDYQVIVDDQMKAFQGITYRCVCEEVGRKTTAAIVLSCMQCSLSEIVFVVASDHLIGGASYREDILRARELVKDDSLITFGMPILEPDTRYGYIRFQGETVLEFVEKPDPETARNYQLDGSFLINSGMFMFRAGSLLQELRQNYPWIYNDCHSAFYRRRVNGRHTYYSREIMDTIQAEAIETTVFEHTGKGKVIHSTFTWKDIGSLEDLAATSLEQADPEKQVLYHCENTTVVNRCKRRVVVANELKDITIINTSDAVYVGKNGASENLKAIMHDNPAVSSFFDHGRVHYRKWGTYEILSEDPGFVVRKVAIREGKTIYAHKHSHRTEHWIIVQGRARIIMEESTAEYGADASVEVMPDTTHQISNIGKGVLVFMEISTGNMVDEKDLISVQSRDLTETELGYRLEPFVMLQPDFKDYLWGGTKLRDIYGKNCDYDMIAESWELSAHDAGQSIVASGRHKGVVFSEYLKKIGKDNWGWKCLPLERFPIMVKLIDAKENLSVQVHPADEYALEHENEYGKSEMWYIVECEENSGLYCGFNRDVQAEEVLTRVKDGTILDILNWIPVTRGEAYFIPAGTVHAIGSGVMICEVQQSSDVTYRLYDYNRRDKYGNKRQLHLEQAMEVMNLKKYSLQSFDTEIVKKPEYTARFLSRCKYFESISYQVNGEMTFHVEEDSFWSFICVAGKGVLTGENSNTRFRAGDSIFIPGNRMTLTIAGICEAVLTHI